MKKVLVLGLLLLCLPWSWCFSQGRGELELDVVAADTSLLVADSTALVLQDLVFRADVGPVALHTDTLLNNVTTPVEQSFRARANESLVQSGWPMAAAGSLNATIDVSKSGGLNYTIPFKIPPGLHEFVPEVGLVYDSQSGNGVAGYGWHIFGTSSIFRVGATMHADGRVGGVNLDSKDRFALDGQRLLLKSGTYGAEGAVYETEQYSNIKIVSRGVHPLNAAYGPAYFEVFYPDGSKSLYGSTGNSRTAIQYALTYTENAQGARINYNYEQYVNSLYVSKIQYGSLSNATGINRIEFSYVKSNRGESSYIGGMTVVADRRLAKVSVVGNGSYMRHYLPRYSQVSTLLYDRMVDLVEYNGAQDQWLTPINFFYDHSNNLLTSQTISNLSLSGIASNNSNVLTADFTGTGTMDFLLYPTSKDKFYAFFDLQPGTGYMQLGYQVNTGRFRDIFPTTWLNHNNKVLSGQGILTVKNNGSNSYLFDVYSRGTTSPIYFQYSKRWDNAMLTGGYWSECTQTFHPGVARNFDFLAGDFNGDGLTDILAISRNEQVVIREERQGLEPFIDDRLPNDCIQVYGNSGSIAVFIDMDRRKETDYVDFWGYLSELYEYGDKLYAADFDGDGKTDILLVKSQRMYVYTLNDNGYLTLLWQTSDSRIVNHNDKPILLGDYNGDGKMDVLFSTGYNNVFVSFMSTGKGFVARQESFPFSNQQNTWDRRRGIMRQHMLVATDVNGDGKTDIIYSGTTTYNSKATGTVEVTISHNLGFEVNAGLTFGNIVNSSRSTNVRHYPIPIFLTPDRRNPNLEYGFISDNTITLFRSSKDMIKESQLSMVWNGGIIYEVSYERLMQGKSVNDLPLYRSSYDETFPYVDIQYAPQLYVTSKISRQVDQTFGIQTFGYGKAVSHAEGLGFLGFGEIIRSNFHAGHGDVNRTYTVDIQRPQLRGATVRSFLTKTGYLNNNIKNFEVTEVPVDAGVSDGATLGDYISRTDHVFSQFTLANKTFGNIPMGTTTKDLLQGTYVNKRMQYDAYYNVLHRRTDVNGERVENTGISYAHNLGAGYYIGRPIAQRDTLVQGTEIFTTEEQYVYTGNLPTQLKKRSHGTGFMLENLAYDRFGNVTRREFVNPFGESRVELKEYDVSGRFMTKYTDIDGLVQRYSYSAMTGNVTRETNTLGLTTSYEHDSWGREIKETDYLGNAIVKQYINYGNRTLLTYEGSDGSFWVDQLDLLGNLRHRFRKNVLGENEFQEWEYDLYGREISETGISKSTVFDRLKTTAYDRYGRVQRTKSLHGKTNEYSYDGLSVTVDDGVKRTVTLGNALGQTVRVVDPGGTVNYRYYANGNIREIDYDGSVQRVEQDGWGRRTKLVDPSAGLYTYQYNGWGELTQEITPKGTTLYGYDNGGKLLSKSLLGDDTDMSWTYTYTGNYKLLSGINLLNADGNASSFGFTYDNFQRLLTREEDNSQAKFTASYLYDGFGREHARMISAHHKVRNKTVSQLLETSYAYGEKLEVRTSTGEILWRIDSIDHRGLLAKARQGQLMNRFTYDANGFPLERRVSRIGGTAQTVMSLVTQFDAVRGAPISKHNSLFNWQEEFGYDNLGRLTRFNDNDGTHAQAYDARGRIVSNSRVGSYSYTGNSYLQKDIQLNSQGDSYYRDRSVQNISYNAFKAPVEIHELGKDRVSFEYNGAMGRAHMYWGDESVDKMSRPYRRHYAEDGFAEITHDTQTGLLSFVLYLDGDGYTSSAIWKEEHGNNAAAAGVYYLHRDYLGSIVMISNAHGAVVEKRHFDAWGNLVRLTDGQGNALTRFAVLDRGFTGHEHLLTVGLIHMNGRLYDARLGRFVSPDNYIQDAYGTQSYNRYAYGFNNPLIYVDPSGEFFFSFFLPGIGTFIDAALWGAVIGGATYTAVVAFSDGGFSNWSWGEFGKSVGFGAISGVAAAGVGGLFGPAGNYGLVGEIGRSMAHGVSNGLISELSGGNFWQGFAAGGLSSTAGSAFIRYVGSFANSVVGTYAFSGIAGGLGSALTGGNFLEGAGIGVMVAGLNHLQDSWGEALARSAERKQREKSQKWSGEVAKCNIFVHDMLVENGMQPRKYAYSAGEWGDPNLEIKGFIIVDKPRRGDIAAYRNPNPTPGNTGHMGITLNSSTLIYSRPDGIKTTPNFNTIRVWKYEDWVYRRYVGKK